MICISNIYLLLLLFFQCTVYIDSNYNPFDDTILYNIRWPGHTDPNVLILVSNSNIVIIFCILLYVHSFGKNNYPVENPSHILNEMWNNTWDLCRMM